jgi:hypothetical protein
MKKIQLNLKNKDRHNLKKMSNTYEDTHMKETSKLEEDVNPDVFLMNLQLKNKDNEHLFNMDFSEFLPTVQKKEELESIQEQEPSYLMTDIVFDDGGGESFSFLDKLDNIDKTPSKIPEKIHETISDIILEIPRTTQRRYSKDTEASRRSYSKDTEARQTLNVIKEEPESNSNNLFKKESNSKPFDNDKIDDFKNQLLKLNLYKTQTINRLNKRKNINNMKLKRPSFQNNIFKKHISQQQTPLRINTTHQIPNDPIFKEPLLNNYTCLKVSSPKYIPPPKIHYGIPLNPIHIDFPYEKELKEQERMEFESQYTQVLPKGESKHTYQHSHITPCSPTHTKNKHTKIHSKEHGMVTPKHHHSPTTNGMVFQNSFKREHIPKQTYNTEQEPVKKKLSYKKALHRVLRHKNKIKTDKYENIPKKVLKDLYRFSNKIDINYSV